MGKSLSEDSMKFIIARLIENAKDSLDESDKDKQDAFKQGRKLAYYEMLDILKSELYVRDADLKYFGLDFDINMMV